MAPNSTVSPSRAAQNSSYSELQIFWFLWILGSRIKADNWLNYFAKFFNFVFSFSNCWKNLVQWWRQIGPWSVQQSAQEKGVFAQIQIYLHSSCQGPQIWEFNALDFYFVQSTVMFPSDEVRFFLGTQWL